MTARRKALIATDVMSPGGVDRYIFDLAMAARRSGYEVSIAVERSSTSAIAPALEASGFVVHLCPLYHRSHDDERIAGECRRLLRMEEPDLLHVVCGIPWSCLILRETAAALGIAMVVTEQYVPEDLELSRETGARIEALYGSSRWVIFVCEGNRHGMGKRLAFDGARTRVIPNAVDVGSIAALSPSARERVARARLRCSDGSLRVMAAARLTPQKGLDLLVEAVGRLGSDAGLEVDLYGEGPERQRLEERCRELGLGATVRFHGWCGNVVAELAEHDLFVIPSRHEGMPYVLLEAMASGIPVIAADVPGIVEALAGGRAGLLVPRDDAAALASKLAAWPGNLRTGFQRAEAASRHVASRHDLHDAMASTLRCWV